MRLGEVERFDPYFHGAEFKEKELKLRNGKFSVVELKSLCKKITDGTHYTPKYTNEGIHFISVKDVRDTKISFNDTKFISKEEHNKFIRRCKPEEGDILFTKVGTVGIAKVIDKGLPEFSIFVSVALLKVNKDLINPNYLALFLNSSFTKFQVDRVLKGIGVPDFHLENIAELLIPLPPLETQQKLVAIMDEAYQIKKTKEQKAKELLDSIDDFVMVELGIEKVESVEKKVFGVRLSALKERIDPEFVLKQTIISKSKFKFVELETLAKVEWGNTNITKASYTENGYLAYSATGQDGFLPFHDFDTKAIILSAIGARCGKCFLAKGKWSAIKNTIVIIPKSQEVSIDFLYTYLDNENIWEKSGGAQPFITMAGANKLLVPLPPLEIQQKIADEVEKRRSQAFELQAEARQVLELAKAEFEGEVLEG